MHHERVVYFSDESGEDEKDFESNESNESNDQEMGLMQNNCERFNFLKNVFILDTGSTISATVMNEELVTNIKKAKIPTIMTTNAGTKILDTEAIFQTLEGQC